MRWLMDWCLFFVYFLELKTGFISRPNLRRGTPNVSLDMGVPVLYQGRVYATIFNAAFPKHGPFTYTDSEGKFELVFDTFKSGRGTETTVLRIDTLAELGLLHILMPVMMDLKGVSWKNFEAFLRVDGEYAATEKHRTVVAVKARQPTLPLDVYSEVLAAKRGEVTGILEPDKFIEWWLSGGK